MSKIINGTTHGRHRLRAFGETFTELAEKSSKHGLRFLRDAATLLAGTPGRKQAIIDAYDLQSCRVCSHCGRLMHRGWCVENGEAYFCSEECVKENCSRTGQDASLVLNCGGEHAYWTEWTW